MRKRIKKVPIASSKNYEESKKSYAKFLREWHEENIKEVEIISASIIVKKKKFVRVFDELIPISETELTIHSTLISIEL